MSTGPNMVPEVPGLARLAWLLFMQPVQLRDAIMRWGIDPKGAAWQLWKTARAGNRHASVLLRRLAVLLMASTPLIAVCISAMFSHFGVFVRWDFVAASLAIGIATGVVMAMLISVAFGITAGAAINLCASIYLGAVDSVGLSIALSAAFGVALSAAIDTSVSIQAGGIASRTYRVLASTALILSGAAIGALRNSAPILTHFLAFTFAFNTTALRLPVWITESIITFTLATGMRLWPHRTHSFSRWLPALHDDLIMLPVPGMSFCLLRAYKADSMLGLSLLGRTVPSPGLRAATESAIIEFQADTLERAAQLDNFDVIVDYEIIILQESSTTGSFLSSVFQSAARDLLAGGRNQRQRRDALHRALATLRSCLFSTSIDLPRKYEQRIKGVFRVWLSAAEKRLRELENEPAEVPSVFVAGTALKPSLPDERSLFKGREDVVRLIEHDLAPTRRGVIFVLGQRRMGKSSLCNWLPRLLGTGTTIVACDFQTLSGDEHRSHPHLRIIEGIGKAVPDLPEPPQQSSSWREALAWLRTIDPILDERRILVTIDEVERVEDGIREGWCTTDFLDFLRATGDAVTHIRVMLLSAFPLRRLGRHWVDRLISVTSLSVSYLSSDHARELLQQPVPDFPPIYPEGGVDRIVAKTHGHPYLLQRVGDELVRRLNLRGVQQATDDDVTAVLDAVVNEGDVPFLEIWDTRTEAERAVLRRLASAEDAMETPMAELDRDATTELVRDGYLERQGERLTIAVPLFRDWIRLFKL